MTAPRDESMEDTLRRYCFEADRENQRLRGELAELRADLWKLRARSERSEYPARDAEAGGGTVLHEMLSEHSQ
jgi:hypothetical protein